MVGLKAVPRDPDSASHQHGATPRRQEVKVTRAEGEQGKHRAVPQECSQHIPVGPISSCSEGRSWGGATWLTLTYAEGGCPTCTLRGAHSLTSPAGDVTGAVISRGEGVWAGRGVVRRAAFLRQPLGKHSGRAQSSFLPRSCLQIRLAQPGCYYC